MRLSATIVRHGERRAQARVRNMRQLLRAERFPGMVVELQQQ
jgi:hypothetical protein